MGLENITFYDCKTLSFISLCESLIPEIQYRRPLERICSIMRKSGTLLLLLHENIEQEDSFAKEYPAVAKELAAVESQDPAAKTRVLQLTFFAGSVGWPLSATRPEHVIAAEGAQRGGPMNEILGTCVVIRIEGGSLGPMGYVLEAVIALPTLQHGDTRAPVLNYFIHVAARTDIVVASCRFTLNASYYCQQNSFSGVCAHSCLKMSIWHLRRMYQPSNQEINQVAHEALISQTRGRQGGFDPTNGLTPHQIEKVCEHFEAAVFDFDCEENPKVSPYEMAYLLVESGVPTIIIFQANPDHPEIRHMVPVIGHTMNTDEWFPFAIRHYPKMPLTPLNTRAHDYISSAEWAPHLIMHDDLLGPYFCIGPNALTRRGIEGEPFIGRASKVLGIFPKHLGGKASPIAAQETGRFYFWNLWQDTLPGIPQEWSQRLQARWSTDTKERDLVLRTQMIERERYIEHLALLQDHLGHKVKLSKKALKLCRRLPQTFWMVEFSLPELFSTNQSKLGEILLPLEVSTDTTLLNAREGQTIPFPLAVRMLGAFSIAQAGNIAKLALNLSSHTRLFLRQPMQ